MHPGTLELQKLKALSDRRRRIVEIVTIDEAAWSPAPSDQADVELVAEVSKRLDAINQDLNR